MMRKIFQDRRDAGRALAKALEVLPDRQDAIVLGLPRGGVPVAYEVARALRLPLDILSVRKLGVPEREELAMGAVASGGIVVFNPSIIGEIGISPEAMETAVEREKLEIERQERVYHVGRSPLPVQGRTVIVVDDGLATGASMLAAVHALRPQARRVIVAVPVSPESTWEQLRGKADEALCLVTPQTFRAVGDFYCNFSQMADEEVLTLLSQAQSEAGEGPFENHTS
jgi:predicted phosphoribosyltransferase